MEGIDSRVSTSAFARREYTEYGQRRRDLHGRRSGRALRLCLEHNSYCFLALRNWRRILKPGGYLILFVPHRDLYEKRTELPSRWNGDYKYFILPEKEELPFTIGLMPIVKGVLPTVEVVYLKECSGGHTITDSDIHSDGEISINMVLQKPL